MHRSITMARLFGAGLFGGVLLAGPALAQVLAPAPAPAQNGAMNAPAPEGQPVSERARARYPQPVRVGDLTGRKLLEDIPEQRVLGRVAGVTRDAAGQVGILVDCCGVLGFGVRRVALPVEMVTLLGPFVVVLAHDGAALAALPEATPAPATLLPATAEIRVGLGRN